MPITLNNNLSTMKVGEYVWCKYTATSGVVGTFSELATKTDADVVGQEIPVASTAIPNGYFRFIMVEDWNGKKRLVADRNIQHSISWDTLNTSGIASGNGLPLASISEQPSVENGFNRVSYAVRLLTGGTASTDKDNEWDKYIVGSNLGGAITVGDNAVWNWSGVWGWTSTVSSASNANRTVRGNGTVAQYNHNVTTTLNGFRPVLEESINEFVVFDKTLILQNGEYKNWHKNVIVGQSKNITPILTSNNAPSPYVASASSVIASPTINDGIAYNAFDKTNTPWTTIYGTNTGWLKLDLGNLSNDIVVKYNLKSTSGTTRTPKNWTFEGSKDNSDWVILDTRNNESNWTGDEVREYSFANTNAYRYYRINISANNGHANHMSISEVELYATEFKEVFLWQTVSSTLPTVNQFIDNGMDSLSPLLDRKVKTLEPQVMIQDSTPVGNGKVYRKKVDLNKYFDIKTISTETRKS